MSPVCSKHLYTIIEGGRGAGAGRPVIAQGFNTKYAQDLTDYHCWCEDEFGKIYDPSPIPTNDPSVKGGGGERHYIKWGNQSKSFEDYSPSVWEQFFKLNPDVLDTSDQREAVHRELFAQDGYHARGGCFHNAHALASGRRGLKVCIGSFGWKTSHPNLVNVHWGQ